MSRATLVACLTEPPSADGTELSTLPEGTVLEVRADLVGDLDVDWLRQRFPGRLLYTLRSTAEGGAFEGGRERRRRRLGAAAGRYDLIDLEVDRDLDAKLLAKVPAAGRVLSWHGPAGDLRQLSLRFEEMTATPAALYKMVPAAAASGEELPPLALLGQRRRDDLLAFASGPIGSWTRLVAPLLGAPWVFAAHGPTPAAPGQLSLGQLQIDYGLPELPSPEALCGIVGRPVTHSLSPRLHNGAYRALGLPLLYLPFHVEQFGDFWMEIVENGSLEALDLPLVGLSVTTPYKEVAQAVAGAASPLANRLGAANTLTMRDGVWEAESTDADGVRYALDHYGIRLLGRRVAVVGAGGAGRSVAFGLGLAGAEVLLVNRTEDTGERVARELGLDFQPLADFRPGDHAVVVNATSLGRAAEEPLPFDPTRLAPGAAVVDLVYGDEPTPLLVAAAAAGAVAIDGREVLLGQAIGQLALHARAEMPEELGRQLLGLSP